MKSHNKIDWIRKLTSRKFWMAVAGLVVGLVIIFTDDAVLAERISGIIMSGASIIGYLLAEGLTDAAHVSQSDAKSVTNVNE